MKKYPVPVHDDMYENVHFDDPAIPVFCYKDEFCMFINHEVSHHWHPEFEVFIVTKGICEHEMQRGGGCRILKPGDGVFINSKTLHASRTSRPETEAEGFLLSLEFYGSAGSDSLYTRCMQPLLRSSLPGFYLDQNDDEDRGILSICREIIDIKKNSPKRALTADESLRMVELVSMLWRRILNKNNRSTEFQKVDKPGIQEDRLRKMIHFIETHYSEGIGVEDIAASAGICKTQCFRDFKSTIGTSPGSYLLKYRLNRAAALLADSEFSVSEVGYQCGFEDAGYFGKKFREYFGSSPGAYRKSRFFH